MNGRPATIHRLFEEQAARRPNAIALTAGGHDITYGAVNAAANQLARRLVGRGLTPEKPVGVFLERSAELVVSLLAVLKAGGAYVPLDASAPPQRLRFIRDDCGVRTVITRGGLAQRWATYDMGSGTATLDLDAPGRAGDRLPTDNLHLDVAPDQIAYITYTSGSTGRPKGARIPHRSVPGFMYGIEGLTVDEHQVCLQYSSIAWDALTLELWLPLLHGARCVLMEGTSFEPAEMRGVISRHGVTILWLTSSLFNLVVDTAPELPAGVPQLLVGGEALSVPHVRRARELYPEVTIINGYGPSECTVFTCCHAISGTLPERLRSIPLGRPVGDRRVYLLDAYLNRVPVGMRGEIYVGGPAVARDYVNRPGLTAERFLPDPFALDRPGDRMYRTGDIARYLPDGTLEFIGRLDDQVKLRGFRVELGEIESGLLEHRDVANAAVVVHGSEAGEKRLVAFVEPRPGSALTVEDLTSHLRDRLPSYMVPGAFVALDRIPLTATGKVDRRTLVAMAADDVRPTESAREYVAPRNPVEERLAELWISLLRVPRVSVHDDFFALGGHSLTVMQLTHRLQEMFGISVPIDILFGATTLEEQAREILGRQLEQVDDESLERMLAEVEQGG